MAEQIYSIGEVSRITGLSKDTLRYYDKINLLKPGHVNPSNHYRYYTYEQFWQIDIIVCCRKLNIPIIKESCPEEVVKACDVLSSATIILLDPLKVVKKEWVRKGQTILMKAFEMGLGRKLPL